MADQYSPPENPAASYSAASTFRTVRAPFISLVAKILLSLFRRMSGLDIGFGLPSDSLSFKVCPYHAPPSGLERRKRIVRIAGHQARQW